jgi:hypothetical protein
MPIAKAILANLVATILVATPKGSWSGEWRSSQSTGALSLRIDSTAAGWSVQIRAVSDQQPSPQFQPANDVRVKGDSVSFSVQWGQPVIFAGKVAGDKASGTIVAPYWSGSWSVRRLAGR